MDLPKRKNIRLKNYDYSQNGAYFITTCTNNRLHLFGEIVEAIHESPEMKTNEFSYIIQQQIEYLPIRFCDISVDKFCIMPNHIHMIICIELGERAIRESPLRSIISQCIGYLKANTTKEIRKIRTETEVWQRGYHDRIIRNHDEYQRIWQYIDENHLNWADDCHNSHNK